MKNNIIFLMSIIFLIMFSTFVIAVPANPHILKLKQPDGYNFKAKQFGDERGAWIKTLDDYTITKDKEGWWVYAKKEKSQILPTEYRVGKVNPKKLGLVKSINPELSGADIGGIAKSSIIKTESPASTEEVVTILIQFSDVSFFPGSTSYWHLDAYNAYGGSGKSWWCGANEPSWEAEPGYGNNWDESLSHEIDLTSATGTITLSFMHKYDMEGGWDYGYVDVYADGSWIIINDPPYTNTGWPGTGIDWTSKSLDLSSYAGKTIKIRFRFISDSTCSDEDGNGYYPGCDSDSAWYIDNVDISDTSGTIFSDDMESGVGNWITSEQPAHDQSYYDNLIFEQTNPRSMYSYYKEVSYNQLSVTGVISQAVTSNYTMAYYGEDGPPRSCPGDRNTDSKNGCIYELTREAVQLADSYIDFSQYDNDGNGVVDHIMIIHAGQGQESSGVSDDIWSHKWYIDACSDPGGNICGEQVDGVEVEKYTMMAEYSPVGTFAHEFAHDLGLPDLYDYDSGDEDQHPVTYWDLMASGSWNDNGNTPSHLSAWSKENLGWLFFTEVNDVGMSVLVNQLETNAEAFKLINSILTASNEYFLVENRQQIGFDTYLPEAGILIWHIDEDMPANDGPPSYLYHRVWVEDPGQTTWKAGAAYSSNDGQTIFDSASTPNSNTNDGIANSASVTNIGTESSAMQADFFGGGEFISITLYDYPIDFGNLDSSTSDNPGIGNPYTIRVDDTTTVNVDIYQKGDDFNYTGETLVISNMSWYNQNNSTSSYQMLNDYQDKILNISSGTNTSSYYWLDIPSGQYAGNYETTIYIKAVEMGTSP
ncbi:MAG: M6 family metalloprotease domain-containing protein [Candidatus Magasanikbacteria bacterium]